MGLQGANPLGKKMAKFLRNDAGDSGPPHRASLWPWSWPPGHLGRVLANPARPRSRRQAVRRELTLYHKVMQEVLGPGSRPTAHPCVQVQAAEPPGRLRGLAQRRRTMSDDELLAALEQKLQLVRDRVRGVALGFG